MFKPLKDITILDLTQVLAGPYGSYQLSLLGANVIKIENPNLGDWARTGGDDKELSDDLMGTSFIVQNGNKRSIRLDLKTKIGKSTFKEFVRQSDVVMENMTPGKLKKLGFSFDNLKFLWLLKFLKNLAHLHLLYTLAPQTIQLHAIEQLNYIFHLVLCF